LGGLKLISQSTSLYAAGEAGLAFIRDKHTGSDPSGSNRNFSTNAWGAGLGSAIDARDLRVSVHVWDADRPRATMTIGLSMAFLLTGL
jgi:hypothetical protein